VKRKGPVSEGTFIFETVDKTCSFSCALSYAYSEETLVEHIGKLRFMFNLIYPGKTLNLAKDPRLHVRNNGSLTDAQYYDGTSSYIKTGNIISLPTKREYEVCQSNP
jgi:hypothetical protein